MNLIKKTFANAMLVGVLFALLVLPIGAMGLTVLKNNNVLSATDVQPIYTEPVPQNLDNFPQKEPKYQENYYPTEETTPSLEDPYEFTE
jgi:hypothetical protein